MTKSLFIVGDADTLEQIKSLAEEAGATCHWVKPKRTVNRRGCIKKGAHVQPINEQQCGRRVLECMRQMPMRRWHTDDIGVYIEQNYQYNHKSATPTCSRLAAAGFIEKTGVKEYRLTAKGRGDAAA